MIITSLKSRLLYEYLIKGGIAVLPTDTIYGIHTPALNQESVERVYQIRGRAPEKPFIILISSVKQLSLFKIKLNPKINKFLKKYWPGPLSVVLPCNDNCFNFLHRGSNSLAFRVPNKPDLVSLLNKTGPLISTSVNPDGKTPAKNITEAQKYFNDQIGIYVDQGDLKGKASTLISIVEDKVSILRQGELQVDYS